VQSSALELARQIDYLGGDPTVKGKEAEYSEDSKTMLEIDLRAEQETIKSYRERIRQAERAGEFALSEKLRTIIAQEQDQVIKPTIPESSRFLLRDMVLLYFK
jgi:bacterioferritin